MNLPRPLATCGRRAAHVLLDTLFPPLCPGCGDELLPGRWICGRCRRSFRPAPPAWFCLRCRGIERPAGDREGGAACRAPGHALLRGRAGFWMEPPLDAVVHALKYGGRDDLARALGRMLAARVDPGRDAMVVSVPLHRARRRERGYNQSELVARAACSRWGLPYVAGVLARTRATRPQARLPEERRGENVAGAFQVVEPGWARGRTWVLVDDVITTGSTLLAAAEELEAAGASRVIPVSFALA